MTVGQKIKDYLEGHGISQTFLAKQTSINQASLNQSLNGGRRLPLEEYERICWALDVPVETFLEPHPPT